MAISIFDLIKIGVGPSSSHTMGPMLAARQFLLDARAAGGFERIERVGAQLYGSLALTGKGHCTDRAILLGLEGEVPRTLEPATVEARLERIRGSGRLRLLGEREIAFDEPMDLLFHREQVLPRHANGMRFTALAADGAVVASDTFYSIGGGFIVRGDEGDAGEEAATVTVPHPFDHATELLEQCRRNGLRIHELVLANESAWRPAEQTRAQLLELRRVGHQRGIGVELGRERRAAVDGRLQRRGGDDDRGRRRFGLLVDAAGKRGDLRLQRIEPRGGLGLALPPLGDLGAQRRKPVLHRSQRGSRRHALAKTGERGLERGDALLDRAEVDRRGRGLAFGPRGDVGDLPAHRVEAGGERADALLDAFDARGKRGIAAAVAGGGKRGDLLPQAGELALQRRDGRPMVRNLIRRLRRGSRRYAGQEAGKLKSGRDGERGDAPRKTGDEAAALARLRRGRGRLRGAGRLGGLLLLLRGFFLPWLGRFGLRALAAEGRAGGRLCLRCVFHGFARGFAGRPVLRTAFARGLFRAGLRLRLRPGGLDAGNLVGCKVYRHRVLPGPGMTGSRRFDHCGVPPAAATGPGPPRV